MSIQVLRLEARAGIPDRLVAHVRGDTRPVTAAKPQPGLRPDVLVLADDVPAARQAIRAAMAARGKRRGRKPKTGLELVFQGPAKTVDRALIEAWARDCLRWYQTGAPRSQVAIAALHADETQFHLHVVASATSESGVGLARIRAELAGAPPGRVGRATAGAQMSAVQSSLWDEVSRRYGLERGEIGSTRQHREIDRSKALDRREENLRNAIGQLRSLWDRLGGWVRRSLEVLPPTARSPAQRALASIMRHASLLGLDTKAWRSVGGEPTPIAPKEKAPAGTSPPRPR